MQDILEQGSSKVENMYSLQAQETASEVDTPTEDHDERVSSSQFLGMESKGCCSCLERFPLWSKLLLLAFIAIFGMIIFGNGLIAVQVQTVERSNNAKLFSTLSARIKNIPIQLGYEREKAVLYHQTKMQQFAKEMNSFRAESSTLLDDMVPTLQSVIGQTRDGLALQTLNQLLTLKSEIVAFRRQFDEGAIRDVFVIIETYSRFISTTLAALMRLCIQSQSQQACLLHNTLLRTLDHFGSNIALGSVILIRNSTNAAVTSQFVSASDRTISYIRYALDIAGEREWNLVNETFNGELGVRIINVTTTLTFWAQSQQNTNLASITNINEYVNITTFGREYIAQVANLVELNIQQVTNSDNSAAIGLLVFIIAMLVLSFVTIIFAAFMFSRSITGPWERMNVLLENTITQFVPRDILGIIRIPRIIDLKYGLVVEKRLTVLKSSIAGFSQIVSNMKPAERFQFYNSFLNAIGPIIRKHSGFIEKYLPDGFVAVFKSNQDGLRAAEELNSYSETFNLTFQNLPNVKLYSSICAGDCLVGTVGESKRMDVSLLGEAASLTQRLSALHTKFKAKLLTTKQTLNSKVKLNYRLLGTLRMFSDKPEVEIFEILTEKDESKLAYLVQFTQAVQKMLANDFEGACPLFEQILQSNPKDLTAEYQYQQCKKVIQEQVLGSIVQLTLDDVLMDDILYDAFQEFCKKELSFENVRVYNLISQFKGAAPNERKRLVQTLYDDFLAAESKYELNVNQKFKQNLQSNLANSNFSMEANALDALQTEIELLMTDTHKRFKQSDALRNAIRKKSIVQV